MPRSLNVLVLGVGGNVSQGILKALALSQIPCRVIGACINTLSFGLYTVDRAYISPAASDPAFPGLADSALPVDTLTPFCLASNLF